MGHRLDYCHSANRPQNLEALHCKHFLPPFCVRTCQEQVVYPALHVPESTGPYSQEDRTDQPRRVYKGLANPLLLPHVPKSSSRWSLHRCTQFALAGSLALVRRLSFSFPHLSSLTLTLALNDGRRQMSLFPAPLAAAITFALSRRLAPSRAMFMLLTVSFVIGNPMAQPPSQEHFILCTRSWLTAIRMFSFISLSGIIFYFKKNGSKEKCNVQLFCVTPGISPQRFPCGNIWGSGKQRLREIV